MDDFEIIQIINDLKPEVRNFKKHRSRNQWQFSCEVCGDSKVDRHKARFGISKKGDVWVCHCFNCSYSNTLSSYLKNFHPNLYERFVFDTFDKQKHHIFELDHLVEYSVSNTVLSNIFFIKKYRDPHDWIEYLENKKIKLKKNNLNKLYNIHKTYWKGVRDGLV